MEEFLSKIAHILIERGLVKLNNRGLASTGSNKAFYKLIDDDLANELDLTRSQERELKNYEIKLKDLCQKIFNERKRERENSLKVKYENLPEVATTEDIDINSFYVFNNYEYSGAESSPSKSLLIKNKAHEKAAIGTSMFYQLHRKKFPEKGDWESFKNSLQLAIELYDPYKILETKDDRYFAVERDETPLLALNTCTHPAYRYLDQDTAEDLPSKDMEFIKSCFSDDASFIYFCSWAYKAITERMPVYLVLLGARQIGKTTLVELLAGMVGEENFFSSAQNGLTSNFDGYKENKRIIEFDEMKLSDEGAVNRVKKDANDTISIEKKGQDVKNAKNFFSGIISSNNTRDFKGLAFDERRLSFVDLTELPTFERGFPDSWMEDFKKRVKEQSWKLSFFKFLKTTCPEEFQMQRAYKGLTFYKTLEENLTGAYLILRDMIISGEYKTISLEEVKNKMEDTRYFPAHHSNFTDFLKNYRHGKEKLILGTYVRARSIDKSYILVSDHFKSDHEENNL